MRDYPLLGIFLTILFLFLFIAWLTLLFSIIRDIFRSDDLGGWGKALWSLFILVIPWLGALAYLVVRGGSMGQRSVEEAVRREEAVREYIRSAADAPTAVDPAERIAKLAALRDAGTVSAEEFERGKAKILA